jgi:hypothetical protein
MDDSNFVAWSPLPKRRVIRMPSDDQFMAALGPCGK